MVTILISSGCTQNAPWRTNLQPQHCSENQELCDNSIWEIHPDYELGFIEFSDRGNIFSNARAQAVYERLRKLNSQESLAIIVFVHGWKHNASSSDKNVLSFRNALSDVFRTGLLGNRKLVGIYIGWRGLSVHGLGLENLSYWDRKEVAEEVGRGGVTDVFLELEKIDSAKDDNFLFIVGHSFGGALTLSALNEVFLERINGALNAENSHLRGFGEGTVIINPAIEANQILKLKEASMLLGGENPYQPSLLHVLSSRGDGATHDVFPLGQALGVGLSWRHEELQRKYKGEDYTLSEYKLDVNTVGNFKPFHTNALIDAKNIKAEEQQSLIQQFDLHSTRDIPIGRWINHSYCSEENSQRKTKRFPCEDNETVSFIYTTSSFIKDHNDVFNKNVKAYFSTLVSEAIFKKDQNIHFPDCADGTRFFFEACFNRHWDLYD